MERIKMKKIIVTFTSLFAFLFVGAAHSGVLLTSPKKAEVDTEEYPESRFGQGPIRKVESEADWNSESNRSPAGLVFEDEKGKADPIGTEEEVPVVYKNQKPLDLVPDRERGVQEVSIIAGDLGYFPSVVFVTRDVPVRMFVTGAAKKTLCIMMDSFEVRRQVKAHQIEEITFTPTVPGKYRFYCPVNGMEGHLVVKDLEMNVSKIGMNP